MTFTFEEVVPYWKTVVLFLIPAGLLLLLAVKGWDIMRRTFWREGRWAHYDLREISRNLWLLAVILRIVAFILVLWPVVILVDFLVSDTGVDVYNEVLLVWMPVAWTALAGSHLVWALPYIVPGVDSGEYVEEEGT